MNKVIIVTGGGRGIGAEVVKQLATGGDKVVINYRSNTQAAEQLCASLQQQGLAAAAFQADVSQENEVMALFDFAESTFGKVTGLVNNAGRLFTQSQLADISLERFQQTFNTNVVSAFLCSREFVRRRDKDGVIVNVSSGAAKSGSPFEYVDYAASKGAMDTMTIGLAKEVADRQIRVNGVRPGMIYTEMHADGGEPGRVDRLKAKIPLQRGGQASEVANAIVWLLSDESSFTTGSFIDVTGGL